MENSKAAIDTNVLIYLYDQSSNHKRTIAEKLVSDGPFISGQVISEFLNTTRRLLSLPKRQILDKCIQLIDNCRVMPIEKSTLVASLFLIEKYDFQLFDSLIVASALESGCKTAYSEDMQHELVVEERLKILNPFI
ncbi:MAG: PIN domain-containing protein [Imperialibacter sp.]|uniref:PIN domain-containing protein n=1 Tax=Imperialibacter sp. TaxID=2038411 RepID=UPI0032EB5F3F